MAVGYRPLTGGIGGFDDIAPPPRQEQSCWQRWQGTVASVAAATGSLVLRGLNDSPLVKVASSFGIGFFAQAAVTLQSTGVSLAKVRQVAFTTFGQVLVFGLSQLWENNENKKVREIADGAIIASLGVNVFLMAHWLWQRGAIRVESNALKSQQGARFADMRVVSQRVAHGVKFLFSGALMASDILASDPVIKSLSAFGWTFFLCQILGEKALAFVDRKIEENDGEDGTGWRRLKTALTTISYAAIPLSMIPWAANPDSSARLKQLQYVGAALGLSDGTLEQSKMARVENHPIETLEEFEKVKDPAGSVQSVAHRVWKVATPLIFVSGLIGFTAWQIFFDLKDADSKIAIGSMLGGFLSTYVMAKCVDRVWNPHVRSKLKDRAIVFFFASPRILGVNPLYLYFAGTNALLMDSKAIVAQQSPLHRITIIASWAFYGVAMAGELVRTLSSRKGSPLTKYPVMLLLNAAITAKFVGQGIIG